ncbi:MAG: SDR family NAD(P)-dependent oxidoreductase [Actinobacteria bacterium]|nr:SDR family NAD(P)-dependent oxidoreductase [Actinomycetota bacterium]
MSSRVAVVTGGASGIGRGIANAFARRGMRLVLADIDGDGLSRTVAELRSVGTDAVGVETDVRDPLDVDALAASAIDAFGRVDIACNNAGVWTLGSQWETSLDDWRRVVDVNMWGVVNGIRTFVPLLLENPDGGHIVNTASMAGLFAGPFMGSYVMTKHAVVGLSKGLRQELALRAGDRVGVTVVCPGRVRTAIMDDVDRRSEQADLAPDVQLMLDLMRHEVTMGITPDEAGEIVADAVARRQFWAFPDGAALLPAVRQDTDELYEVLGGAPQPSSERPDLI